MKCPHFSRVALAVRHISLQICETLKYLFDGENKTRVCAAKVFLVIGALAAIVWLIFRGQQFFAAICANRESLLWSSGWTAIGIGIGLINDKNNSSNRAKIDYHYWTYFAFVLFVGTVTGVVAFLGIKGKEKEVAYLTSSLVALAIGFSGDSLAGVIVKNAKIK